MIFMLFLLKFVLICLCLVLWLFVQNFDEFFEVLFFGLVIVFVVKDVVFGYYVMVGYCVVGECVICIDMLECLVDMLCDKDLCGGFEVNFDMLLIMGMMLE